MPEYSSTTITPSDGVQVPGMNGSTSGNFLLSALKSYILAEKGLANGLASLDGNGKLTASQLPDLADDVIVVASYASLPATGTAGKIYITADNNKMYRWDPDLTTPDYVELSVDLSAYATKAELSAEESSREAADSNLKSAIDANFLSCLTSGVFSIYRFTQHNGNLANGGIWNNVNSSYKHVVIPVYSGLSLKLKTASDSPICGNFGFVKTYSEPSEGGTVDYSSQEGYTGKFVMGGQLEFSLTCPSDCKYLILENYYSGAYTPFSYLYLGSRNLLEDISEKSIKYVGDISYLGITTLGNLQERGYYNCPAGYLSSLTDLPTDLTASQGFDLFVFPQSAGGTVYQLLINNLGLAWFRYGQNEFKPFNHRLVSDDITWYALGDSITQGVYSTGPNQSSVTSENWVNLVASKTGFRVTNYGVGGSGYVDNTHATDGKNAKEKADTIDFSTCDLVTLAYGINDWKYGYPLGSMSDNIADGGTMYANMRYVIEKIITDNPNCKILVITPLNCMGYAFDYGNESTNWGLGYTISGNGKTLQDFYNGMKEICDYYGIELIDQTHTSVVNRKSIIGTLLDGVHPSLDCHKALGHELAKKIKFM